MVITVVGQVFILFPTIIFDVGNNNNLLLDKSYQQHFLLVIHEHHKQIIIDTNYAKNLQTVTNRMVVIILTLHKFLLVNLEFDTR